MLELICFCGVFLVVSVAVVTPIVIAFRRRCPRCSAALLLLSDFVSAPGTGRPASMFSDPAPPSGWSRYRCTGCKAEFWRHMQAPGVGGELISAESFDPGVGGLAQPGR